MLSLRGLFLILTGKTSSRFYVQPLGVNNVHQTQYSMSLCTFQCTNNGALRRARFY